MTTPPLTCSQTSTKAQVLKARARLLAQSPKSASRLEEGLEMLEFQVANEKYGLESAGILEVCVLKDYTRLPGTPAFVTGIFSLRGRVVALLDLRVVFDLPREGLPYQNKVVVIGNGTLTMGLLADEVLGLKRLPLNQLQPPLPSLAGRRAGYLRGLAPDGTAVLEVARILADTTLIVQEEVLQIGK